MPSQIRTRAVGALGCSPGAAFASMSQARMTRSAPCPADANSSKARTGARRSPPKSSIAESGALGLYVRVRRLLAK